MSLPETYAKNTKIIELIRARGELIGFSGTNLTDFVMDEIERLNLAERDLSPPIEAPSPEPVATDPYDEFFSNLKLKRKILRTELMNIFEREIGFYPGLMKFQVAARRHGYNVFYRPNPEGKTGPGSLLKFIGPEKM